MGRPEKPVDPARGAVAGFAADLRKLRERAGTPTYRELARHARFSPSVLSSAASGHRLPSLHVTLAFVAACGGDQEDWRRRWLRARGRGEAEPPEPAPAPAPPSLPRDPDRMPRPTELPLRPRGYALRKETLRRLATGPLAPPVVVSGPFGTGKSELALRYAHGVADTMEGHLYVDFASLARGDGGARAALDGLLSRLGIPPDRIPGPVAQRAGLYRSLLGERRLVVMLDNVRDERQVRPLLPESRCSLTIIASRAPLLGLRDVRRVRLDVLPRAESIALIGATASRHASADAHACDWLAEMCADLPLALDIATRRLADRPDVPLADVVSHVTTGRAWLDWLRVGDLSVREALDSAYRQLSDAARLLLQLLVSPRAGRPPHPHETNLTDELVQAGLLRRGHQAGDLRVDALTRAFMRSQGLSRTPEPVG